MRRENWRLNHKPGYRTYKLAGLNLRSKRPRRSRAAVHREVVPDATGPNEVWTMGFLTEAQFDGRRFRILSILECFRDR